MLILRDDLPGLPFADHWDLPGGGREGDETPEETLAREVREEVGLDMAAARPLWRRRYPAVNRPGAHVWFFVAAMEAEAEGRIVFGDEGQRWALMAPDEVLSLSKIVPSFPGRLRDYHGAAGAWGAAVPVRDP